MSASPPAANGKRAGSPLSLEASANKRAREVKDDAATAEEEVAATTQEVVVPESEPASNAQPGSASTANGGKTTAVDQSNGQKMDDVPMDPCVFPVAWQGPKS